MFICPHGSYATRLVICASRLTWDMTHDSYTTWFVTTHVLDMRHDSLSARLDSHETWLVIHARHDSLCLIRRTRHDSFPWDVDIIWDTTHHSGKTWRVILIRHDSSFIHNMTRYASRPWYATWLVICASRLTWDMTLYARVDSKPHNTYIVPLSPQAK